MVTPDAQVYSNRFAYFNQDMRVWTTRGRSQVLSHAVIAFAQLNYAWQDTIKSCPGNCPTGDIGREAADLTSWYFLRLKNQTFATK